MSIWDHSAKGDFLGRERLLEQEECPFCHEPLAVVEVKHEDIPAHLADEYLSEESPSAMGGLSGPPDPLGGADCELNFCESCGWWSTLLTVTWKFSGEVHGAGAALRNFNLKDLSLPLQEVRDYLTARYESRRSVDPVIFEQVVGSVFSDFGYKVDVVGKTGDGGIDAVLRSGSEEVIGVQVKRYKERIEAEQIRSFVGALVLGQFTKGIYVTTSKFRSGARSTAAGAAHLLGLPIELYDADRFLSALKIAQKSSIRDYDPATLLASLDSLEYIGGDAGYASDTDF